MSPVGAVLREPFDLLWHPSVVPRGRVELIESNAESIDGMKRLASRSTWWHTLPHRDNMRSTPQRGRPAMDHIGMDVHKMESQISILTEAGELIERRVRTEPERFAAVLGDRPRARWT